MNSSLIAKRSNISFFALASVLSIAMLVGGGFLLKNLISGNSGEFSSVAEKSCITVIQSNGFIPDNSKSGEIKVSRASAQVETLVFHASVLIASCPAYTLTDFCAGAVCQTPGVSFTLKFKEL